MKCFVDTSAFVALYNENDTCHKRAKEILQILQQANALLSTTRDIIAEAIILIRRRGRFHQALQCGNDLWNNPNLEVIRPTQNHDHLAWELFEKYSDKELSFVDCVSFAVMEEMRIQKAFTFDKHFKQVGFEEIEV